MQTWQCPHISVHVNPHTAHCVQIPGLGAAPGPGREHHHGDTRGPGREHHTHQRVDSRQFMFVAAVNMGEWVSPGQDADDLGNMPRRGTAGPSGGSVPSILRDSMMIPTEAVRLCTSTNRDPVLSFTLTSVRGHFLYDLGHSVWGKLNSQSPFSLPPPEGYGC